MQLSIVITPLIGIVISPGCASLASRIGSRNIVLFCLTIFSFGLLLTFYSGDYKSFLISRIIQAIGSTGLSITTLAMIMECRDPSTIIKLSGFFSSIMPISWCISPLWGSFFIDLYGIQTVFGTLTFTAFSCLILFFISSHITKLSDDTKRRFSYRIFSEYFKNIEVLSYSLAYAFPLGLFCFLTTINPLLCSQVFDASPRQVAVLQSFSAVIVILTTKFNRLFLNRDTKVYNAIKLFWFMGCITLMMISNYDTPYCRFISLILHNTLASSLIGFVSYPSLQILTVRYRNESMYEFSSFISTFRNIFIVLIMLCFSLNVDNLNVLNSSFFLTIYPLVMTFFTIISKNKHAQLYIS